MRTRTSTLVVGILAVALCSAAVPSANAAPPERGAFQLASTSAADRTRPADNASSDVDITPDGRFMVFSSNSRDLVASPSNPSGNQVYLRDTESGNVRMISTTADGSAAGNWYSTSPAISDDGKWVAFITASSNIAAGAANGLSQAVVWNRDTGMSVLASVGSTGAADKFVDDVDISGDGRVVAFSTAAANLASIPTYNKPQLYRRDLAAEATSIISVSDTGNASVIAATSPSVSRDGSAIAFAAAGIEIDGNMSEVSQIYRHVTGAPELSVVSAVGGFYGANGASSEPSISADGNEVVYSSVATNLVSEAARGNSQIYHRHVSTRYTSIVSTPPHRGGSSNGECTNPSFGADATRVAFVCTSTDLLPGTDGSAQLYVAEIPSGQLRLVTRAGSGELADRPIAGPSLSGDGSLVAFSSEATNLVPGSSRSQVFLGTGVAKPAVERIGGVDRYAASAAVSRATFPPGVPVAYIASGQGFADALAGSAIAGLQSGPVMLVTRDGIPSVISAELGRLKPAKIVVLGGVDTIDRGVERALAPLSPSVVRVAGSDRYLGAALLSASVARGGLTAGQSVYVAAGENYPDALAAAAAAGYNAAPVLLTQRDSITPEVVAEILRLRTTSIEVVGGTSSVSKAVADRLAEIAPVTRHDGRDRYETAAKIAGIFTEAGRTVYIASGETYPDALSASAAAVQSGSPVLLVAKSGVPDATKAVLRRLEPTRIIVVGGSNTIADSVLRDLEGYLAP